jgi:hypothetical protein
MLKKSYIVYSLIFFFLFPVSGFAVTYATFDSAHKGTSITLTNGDLTMSSVGATWGSGFSTIAKSTGKWYWEYTIDSGSGSVWFGIACDYAEINSYITHSSCGWGYRKDGHKMGNNGSDEAYGATFTTGDVIGVAFDGDSDEITMYKNGASQGVMYTGLTNTYYGAVSLGDTGVIQMTANFGSTAFAYTVPTGYCEGLSDTCVTTGGEEETASTTLDYFDDPSYLDWLMVVCILIFFISIPFFIYIFPSSKSY